MEIMVAVVLLAICAVPMGEAIRHGLTASTIGVDQARELRCMKNTMETILAEPYPTLWAAAKGKDILSTYQLPEDPSCAGLTRQLYIALYAWTGQVPSYLAPTASQAERESALLHIELTSDKAYSFKTLVAQ